MIACEDDPAAGTVDQHEREHSLEPLETVATPALAGGQQHLGVAAAAKRIPLRRERGAQLDVVVDLAVVGQPHPLVG